MKLRIAAATIAVAAIMAGCASLDGTYAPDCRAYAGNRITLDDGRFVWEKFTDQVVVGDDGEIVDQYPQYPLDGRYRVEGDTVHFEADSGEPLPSLHLQEEGNKTYLLTDKQQESWRQGVRPRCPLSRTGM